MSHQLQLEVPDDTYQWLVKTAQETGETVEELAVRLLRVAMEQKEKGPPEK